MKGNRINNIIFNRIPSYKIEKYFSLYKYLLKKEILKINDRKEDAKKEISKKLQYNFDIKHTKVSTYYLWKHLFEYMQTNIQLEIPDNTTKYALYPKLAIKYLTYKINEVIIPRMLFVKKHHNLDMNIILSKHLMFSTFIINNQNNPDFLEENVPDIFNEKELEITRKKINIFVGKFDISKFMLNEQVIKVKKNGMTNTFVFMNKLNKKMFNGVNSKYSTKKEKSRNDNEVDDEHKLVPVSGFTSFKFIQKHRKCSSKINLNSYNSNSNVNSNLNIGNSPSNELLLTKKLHNKLSNLNVDSFTSASNINSFMQSQTNKNFLHPKVVLFKRNSNNTATSTKNMSNNNVSSLKKNLSALKMKEYNRFFHDDYPFKNWDKYKYNNVCSQTNSTVEKNLTKERMKSSRVNLNTSRNRYNSLASLTKSGGSTCKNDISPLQPGFSTNYFKRNFKFNSPTCVKIKSFITKTDLYY